jgi:hypothetical protein
MRLACKIFFFGSLITIACTSFGLLAADIDEGTGDLTGLEPSCGDCNDGGSSCDAPHSTVCDSEDGECRNDCPGTQGRVCQEKSDAGRWCEDGSTSCPDGSMAKCVSYIDQFGYKDWKCSETETESHDCGDARNTCEYKTPTP